MTRFRETVAVCASLLTACGKGSRTVGSSAPAASSAVGESDVFRQSAVSIVRGIHGSQWEGVYDWFGADFRAAIPKEKHRETTEQIERARGKLVDAAYAEESPIGTQGARQIRVLAVFERGAMVYTVSLDRVGVLQGLTRTALVPSSKSDASRGPGPADDYVAKRAYAFPGRGEWHVGQGGRDPADNAHVGNTQQWYAFDLVRTGPQGKTHRVDGTKNEDFYIFGAPILAPADGTIVAIVDGVADNVPGDENKAVATGNHIVIDHGAGEYSLFCHVEMGTFTRKVGAHVKAGDVIGKVGNSGNASEPHLHWQLTDDARLAKGHGLPIRFAPMRVNGKLESSPSPKHGDVLDP